MRPDGKQASGFLSWKEDAVVRKRPEVLLVLVTVIVAVMLGWTSVGLASHVSADSVTESLSIERPDVPEIELPKLPEIDRPSPPNFDKRDKECPCPKDEEPEVPEVPEQPEQPEQPGAPEQPEEEEEVAEAPKEVQVVERPTAVSPEVAAPEAPQPVAPLALPAEVPEELPVTGTEFSWLYAIGLVLSLMGAGALVRARRLGA